MGLAGRRRQGSLKPERRILYFRDLVDESEKFE